MLSSTLWKNLYIFLCMCEWELCQEIGGSSSSHSLRTCYSSCYSVPCEALGTSTAGVALSILITLAVSKESNYYQIIILLFCGFGEVLQTVRKDLFLVLDEIGHILSWLFGSNFIFLHSPGASEMNGWPWVAFCQCSTLEQTHNPLFLG